jgi:hypothetical protein
MNPLTAQAIQTLNNEELNYSTHESMRTVPKRGQFKAEAVHKLQRKGSTQLKVAIEYHAPYFVVLVKNPGQNGWVYVESKTHKIHIQNMFGDVVKTKPAVEKFQSYVEADTYVQQNMPHSVLTKRATGFLASMFTHSNIVE